ncbi:MAG TPA: prepilin-type N-terminal cleavage/methylation domain-containing protein [Gemmatimonadaceae bacterium]
MSAHRIPHRRSGVSLVELLVAMTLLGVVGLSILRTFTSQARLADLHAKRLDARSVSRAPVNLFMSEARMVETGNGVVAASASSVTLRIPVMMGLVCGSTGSATALSVLPVDSATLASAAVSGHAWRQVSGAYAYTEGAVSFSAGGAAVCASAAASITTVPDGRTIIVSPEMVGASVGTVAFLYQTVRYDFAASSTLAGRVGLWRTLAQSGATEELAAPFDASSRFRFYRVDQDTSDVVVPPLTEIRGLELELIGASKHSRFGRGSPETSRHETAVFFMNRLN